MRTKMSLVFLIDEVKDCVLLGQKKTGFGQGRILGIGGKADPGEAIISAACREVGEEVNLSVLPENLVSAGTVEFIFPEKTGWHHEVSIFTCKTWSGIATESSEIKPQWVPMREIPFEKMWDDAKYWLPKVLQQEKVNAKIYYDDDLKTVKTVEWL